MDGTGPGMGSTRERVNQQIENNGEDDEFDFGGFEAAEPVADMPSSEAAASPWAVLTTGNAAGRPDLLCAQNRFPNCLDPSDITGASGGALGLSNPDINVQLQASPLQSQVDLFREADIPQNQNLLHQARIADNILDGTLNADAGENFHSGQGQVNGNLPDIGLGINENRLFAQGNLAGAVELDAAQTTSHPAVGSSVQVAGPSTCRPEAGTLELSEARNEYQNRVEQHLGQNGEVEILQQDGDSRQRESTDQVSGQDGRDNGPARDSGELWTQQAEGGLDVPPTENLSAQTAPVVPATALQEQLERLLQKNQATEEELRKCRSDLTAQRLRVQDVEKCHEEQLRGLRSAGNDALAIALNQYKEQAKTVVLEQQESARCHLLEVLKEQNQVFQNMLQAQQSQHEEERLRQQQELEERIQRSTDEAQRKQQEQFEAFLAQEREDQKKFLQEAVEHEQTACQERLDVKLAQELKDLRAHLDTVKKDHLQQLEEERRNHQVALEAMREEMQQRAQERMAEVVAEERARGRQALQTWQEEGRQETRAYVQEQRQADSRLRQRHLASLDLFLECSRQQIALLLDSESSNTDNDEKPGNAEGDS